MLKILRSLFSPTSQDASSLRPQQLSNEVPTHIRASNVAPFPLAENLVLEHGLPVPDWGFFFAWLDTIPEEASRTAAWDACEMAWLQHLREALGPSYHLAGLNQTLILSSLEAEALNSTFAFMNRTSQRILKLLAGMAEAPAWGHDILIIFDDEDTYYNYVARYYAGGGEYSMSSGMHISAGCSHFVTTKSDLQTIEPIIAHEMTHRYLAHLPIPIWLNEGIAVNTEQRICPPPAPLYSPQVLHEKHRHFWGPAEIQTFWSGDSFHRADEGNMLSYDLARILVGHFSADWDRFQKFVLSAHHADAGQAAAVQNLELSLGAAVASIMAQTPDESWEPLPALWHVPPEHHAPASDTDAA